MVIVAGKIVVDPEQVEQFKKAVARLTRVSRQEDGCIQYALLVDDAAAGEVVVIERWRDEPALRAHLATAHVKAFLDEVGSCVRSMNARLFDASNERDVM